MSAKPLISRKDTKALEDAQRRAVRARDKGVCCFEKFVGGVWRKCGVKDAHDTAHCYRRRNCAKAIWHVDVALLACRDCHTKYDNREGGVRVPPAFEERAYKTICENSKVKPPRQSPEGYCL